MNGCANVSPPLSEPQVAGFTARLNEKLSALDDVPSGLITMDDAVERAIKNNHSIRAQKLDAALTEARVTAESGSMLPSIVAENDYFRRESLALSRSSQSSTFSTSSDISRVSRDITLSWNILDFGLSYIRAKQGLDMANQKHEDVRLVGARIAEETRSAFWRAVALEKMKPAMAKLSGEVEDALRLAREASLNSQLDPMTPIAFQRELLELQRDLNQIHTGLAGAEHELRELMGLQGTSEVNLDHQREEVKAFGPVTPADEDIGLALRQRPEIRKHMYDLRITEDEIDATILQALPGVTFNRSYSSDSTSFLLNSNWVSWGTTIAGDLVRLARVDADLDVVGNQEQFQRQSALATAATIVMQVHVARARFAVQGRAFRDAEQSATMQRQIRAQVRAAVQSGKTGKQELTREKMETLLAEVRAILAYADLQAGAASYATAKGDLPFDLRDPVATGLNQISTLPGAERHALGGPQQ